MIKVMIVDDEILVRLALRASIDWSAYQLTLIAEAEDGIQAIEYIEKFRPDIIITDISMPHLNGIELIQDIKEKYPEIEFIVLSCHNEYDYVREAMKLGAVDYILKLSMDVDELIATVCRVRDRILEKNKINNDKGICITDDKWRKLILEVLNNQDPRDNVDELQFDLEKGNFAVAIFAGDMEKDKPWTITEEINKSIRGIIETIYGQDDHVIIIDIEVRKCLIVFKYKNREEYDKLALEHLNKSRKIIELTASYLELDISCGISNVVEGYKNIKNAYTQAYSAVKSKFYFGKQSINRYKEKSIIEENIIDTELIQHTDTLNKAKIQEGLKHVFAEVEKTKEINPRAIKKYLHEMLFYLNKSASDFLGKSITFESIQEGYHKINEAMYLAKLKSDVNQCIDKFWEEFEDICNKNYRREIILAKKYILNNYNQDINIAKVSKYVNLSPDYFSHLFKKEMGINFSKYLNEMRIEKAKSLMNKGDFKVYEVAYKVGYENESYFIRKFKEIVGITPIEYIRKNKK